MLLRPLGWSEGHKTYGKIRTIPTNRDVPNPCYFAPGGPERGLGRKETGHRKLDTPSVK